MPVTVGLGIVQIGMLARMLGPEGIGVLTLFIAASALFGSLLKFTSAEAIMVYVTKALTGQDEAQASWLIRFYYLLDFSTSFIALGALALFALIAPRLLDLSDGQGGLMALYGLTIVFQSTYWVSHSLLRLADKFSLAFYQSVAHSVVKTVAMALLYITRGGLTEVVFLLVGLSLLDGVGLYLLANFALRRKGLSTTTRGGSWWNVPGEVWRFQWLAYGRQVVKSMSRYVDSLMIGYMANPVQVGFFRAGKQVGDQIKLPAQGLVMGLFPEYSRLYYSGDSQRLRRLVGRFFAAFLVMGLLVGLVVWFGADIIITIVFGEEFLPAKNVLRVLMVSGITLLIMSPVYSLPAAVGRAGPALRSVAVATLVQIGVIIWLVPQQGALGAAFANLTFALTWALVLLPSVISVLWGSRDRVPQPDAEYQPGTAQPADSLRD